MRKQAANKSEPYYILAMGNCADFSAVTDILTAEKSMFCHTNRLAELATLLEEVTAQIVIIDLTTWGTSVAQVLSEHVRINAQNACICLVSREQFAEIRSKEWSGFLHLVAKDALRLALPAVIRQCKEAQRMYRRTEELLQLEKQSLYNTLSKEAEGMKPEDRSIFDKDITRRSFLKGTAAAAAAAGVAMSGGMKLLSPAEAAGGEAGNVEQVFRGACRGNCAANCPIRVHVRGGKIVKTSKLDMPVPEFERICQRGLTHAQRTYQPDRLTHPLRRAGARGEGKWEQITWQDAIDEICAKWKEHQAKYGKESVAHFDGWGITSPDVDYYQRLFNLMGSVRIINSMDLALATSLMGSVGVGAWFAGDDPRNMQDAKYIFAWGSNFTEAGAASYAFLQAALDRGAKLIVINPNYINGAIKADWYVPIRPGTDAILAMAMTNIAVAEGKIDTQTLMRGTVAPFLVKKSDGNFLRLSDLGQAEAGGTEDAIVVRSEDGTVGTPAEIERPVIYGSFRIQEHAVTTAYDLLLERVAEWTPERAAELCDIPLGTIYELAHLYMEGPSTLYLGYGPDHWGNGHCFYYAVTTLAMVTGQIGKKGAGIGGASVSVYTGAGFGSNMAILSPPEAKPGPSFFAPKLPDAIKSGKYGDTDVNIKSLFIYKHNLLGNQTDRKAWFEAFNQIEFIAITDVVMNETTKYADIVLPAPHFFEVETYMETTSAVLIHSQKAIDPPGEAMGDFEIANLFAKGMGYGEQFTMSREEYLEALFDNDRARANGINWSLIKEKGYIPMINHDTPLYLNGEHYVYPTPTGRAQFYRENPAPNTNFGQAFDKAREALPYWEPPIEGWHENELAKKYPLIFLSERPKFKCHTSYSHNPWLLELQPEPTVMINPIDAEARGIRHGDIIKVYNDRGYVVIKTVLNPATRPGTLNIDHGWVEDEFIEGHYQDLSSNRTSHAVINNAFFDCLVQAEKV